MNTILRIALPLALMLLLSPAFSSQATACEGLDAGKQGLFDRLLATLHPYDCCDDTLEACQKKTPLCPLVPRLTADVCRLVKEGKTQAEVEHAMLRRAQSMTPGGKPVTIEMDDAVLLGEPDAPVSVVIYACTRCPFCRVAVLELYREVTEGALKGKVKLHFRPFPLKDHPGSLEGGLALIAAAKLGKFWPYVVKVYENYNAFKPELLAAWAVETGMDRAAFEAAMGDEATREALNRAKQEGIRNRVSATPSLFINGRRYVYDHSIRTILDLIAEEVERLAAEAK